MSEAPEAPLLPGLTVLSHLGTGGYSEVWECQQDDNTKLKVAVKVLRSAGISDTEREQFAIEAATMAELAGHPYIVQVSRTGTTESGLPYLVMKLYTKPNLAEQAASRRISVEEALRIGINLSSAVETAHRAGFLHRDIKPANVLIDQYDEPGLADFGIAGKSSETADDDDLGVSVPWSPPEVLGGASNGSIASDVYSLAATLWHVLAGRSPFEVPGGDNRPKVLVGRILKSPAPATGRSDVPDSLNRLLQQALAKKPELRPKSALEFARMLQQAQQSLRFERTKITVSASEASPATVGFKPPPAPTAPIDGSSRGKRATATSDTALGYPATTVRPMRPRSGGGAPEREVGGTSTTVRPTKPAAQAQPVTPVVSSAPPAAPGTSRRPRVSKSSPAAEAPGFASPDLPRRSAERGEATRARGVQAEPITDMPQEASSAATPRQLQPSSTVRRPTTVTEAGLVNEPSRKRLISTPVAVSFGIAVVIVAVVVGVIVSSGGRTAAPAGKQPKPPVGSDAGGFAADGVTAPSVDAAFEPATHILTFTWHESRDGASGPFTYRVNGGMNVGPTTATHLALATKDPANECIMVAALSTDGTQHPSALVCG